MKTCKGCGQEKKECEFGAVIKKTTGREYFRKICRVCKRMRDSKHEADTHLERKYGISRAQWEMILKSQDGKCKICGTILNGTVQIDTDHDHKTHVIRGLLCVHCNRGLGHFRDDPERLRIAANYLETANALKEILCKHS